MIRPYRYGWSVLTSLSDSAGSGGSAECGFRQPLSVGALMSNHRKSLKPYRIKAYHSQQGLCFYCHQPMWLSDPKAYADQFGLRLSQAHLMRCTGEHLIAHSEGGPASGRNIVAACWFCNSHRHRRKSPLPTSRYKEFVSRRLGKGGWHGLVLVK